MNSTCRRPEPTPQTRVKHQVAEVAEEILDVVAEDPQEQHVSRDMRDARVQKHAGQQRQKCSVEIDVARKVCRETRRNRGVGHQERFQEVGRQGELIEKDGHVGADQGNVNHRHGAVRRLVF